MRVEDLSIGELVEFDSEDGVVRFAGRRALIIDATEKGNLRKDLVNHFGLSTARAILTRFGFVQGWRKKCPHLPGGAGATSIRQ